MATGDSNDFVRRLRAALPLRWFPDDSPVLVGVLTGFAAIWGSLYDLLQYVIKQARIATASGVFLDMVAADFFSGRITRNQGEPDAHFRRRISSEILRPRATRAAVAQALFDLTGVEPIIFEPANTTDTGGYNIGGVGYNVAGGWGDLNLPFEAFITAFRPAGGGIAGVSGYGNIGAGIASTGGLGGYGQGAIEWADLEMVTGAITDSDIYAVVAAAMPAATIGWTRGLAATAAQIQQALRPAFGFSRVMSSASGALTAVAGALVTASGTARSAGRATLGSVVTGSGGASGLAAGTGKTGVLSMAFAAAGFAKSSGRQIYGNVVILVGRGTGRGSGALATAATALGLVGRGSASATGTALGGTQQALPSAPANLTASDATPNTMTLTWSPSTGAP